MKTTIPRILISAGIGAALFLGGCATPGQQTLFTPRDLNPQIRSGQYTPKTNHFIILLDASGSMGDTHEENQKVFLAKEAVRRIHRTIPNIPLEGALRTFGNAESPFAFQSDLLHRFSDEGAERDFEETLNTVEAGGKSPLGLAITETIADLKPLTGKTAVIIVTDGILADDPVPPARNLKATYGEAVCIYTVFVGDHGTGRRVMEAVTRTGECGFMVDAEAIFPPEGAAAFVKEVFLTDIADRDGDGVPDDRDQCPDSPAGSPVDADGCPPVLSKPEPEPKGVSVQVVRDRDGDGIPDETDECPRTPTGARVDARGCWIIEHIRFDTNQSKVKPEYRSVLDAVAAILKVNPDFMVVAQGHTDNVGSAAYNMALSLQRARAVEDYLLKVGVPANRVTTIGYGFTEPIAPNSAPEGRANNRRVNMQPLHIQD
jgi:OmpA-OmpF porin, OOP family